MMTIVSLKSFGQSNIRNPSSLEKSGEIDCENGETTFEMRICANLKFQFSDSIMNSLYQETLLAITSDDLPTWKTEFKTSHETWKKYREEHCRVYAKSYEGGTLQPIIYLTCMRLQTEKRIGDLRQLLTEIK